MIWEKERNLKNFGQLTGMNQKGSRMEWEFLELGVKTGMELIRFWLVDGLMKLFAAIFSIQGKPGIFSDF